jgi:hypothetical protein
VVGALVLWFLIGDESTRCTPPPEDFSEASLVGTWGAVFPGDRTETLILQENDEFRQVVAIPVFHIDYMSEPHRWWIEDGPQGIPYLHLEGMSLCGWAPDEVPCDVSGAGEMYWYDECEDRTFQMPPGEIILIITGVREQHSQPPRGIQLRLPSGHERSWLYWLVDE